MKNRLFTKEYTLSLLAFFGINLNSNLLLSVMSLFAQRLSATTTQIGLMTSLFSLSALLVRLSAGVLIDRFGCKRLTITGLMLMCLSTFGYLFCDSIPHAFAFRICQGLGFGIATTSGSTAVVKACPQERMMEGVGYASVAATVTSAIGPTVAYSILGSGYAHFSPLFLSTGAVAVCSLILACGIPKGTGEDKEKTNNKISTAILWKWLMIPVFATFASSFTQSAFISFLAIFMVSLGFAGAGFFFSLNALGMLVSRAVATKLVKRYQAQPVLIVCGLLFFLSMIMISQTSSSMVIMLLAFPCGFAQGIMFPILNIIIIQLIPADKKGLANAIFYSALDIGYGGGSLLWGMVAGCFGYRMIFILAGVVQLIGAGLNYCYQKARSA